MRLSRSFRLSVAAVACTGLLSLAACSEDSEPESETAAETSETPADDTTEDVEPVEDEVEAEPTAAAGQPEWANPATSAGDLISTIEAGDVTVEVFQVGTAKATKDGNFADPETNKPLLAKGEEIVFVNYVVTNDGDPIDLGASLVSITARYDDWKWLQGMDSSLDDAQFEELGLNTDALAPGAYRDPSVYTLGTGETYSYAENFKYQKGSPITFEAVITPVDAEGELLHDDRIEGTGTGTIV
ncbi:hypothetical protein GHK92_01195 [Nocardioides sp. dk4132]|uniref:hypothetical protein n=1 Tax=unclassified Nocardioides TaxID=2615069 RepID=UPI0012956BA1|nr:MULTISPECIES: hypothetical protein [unclassified Nocardioides]MQW74482.1 hypothetical protein [Nocardioides sp. dk4132]QGA06413.1 hypothetical protein GFH29_02640 [Nocardioides sp. dk884]